MSVAKNQESTIDDLRRAIAVRDDFIAIAAHELRNPMTPIAGQVELLVARAHREGASPAMIAGLERLELAIEHYLKRATILLEVSRINAGQVRLQPSTFDMADLVALTTRNYRVLAERAGSVLQCQVERPVVGRWDRLSSEQVLDNLLSNAIRYGAGKPIRIELAQVGDDIVLKVSDEGIGIPAPAQERIFERFERGGAERTSGGFGVGLWLVRQLVEAQGGKIEVRSKPSEGSTFIVQLPRDITGQIAEHP